MRTLSLLLWGLALFTTACGPRVVIATGTTLGLKATPGDGNSRPPQVTLGYKRAEAAIVPTSGKAANGDGSDAFSTMAAFDFRTRFFGETELASFVGTGFAVEDIQGNPGFRAQFAAATVGAVPVALEDRKVALAKRLDGLSDSACQDVLTKVNQPLPKKKLPCTALRSSLVSADEKLVDALEDAFPPIAH